MEKENNNKQKYKINDSSKFSIDNMSVNSIAIDESTDRFFFGGWSSSAIYVMNLKTMVATGNFYQIKSSIIALAFIALEF